MILYLTSSHMIVFWVYFHILKIENTHFIWKVELKESVFFEAHWFALSWFSLAQWCCLMSQGHTQSHWIYPAFCLAISTWAFAGAWTEAGLPYHLLLCSCQLWCLFLTHSWSLKQLGFKHNKCKASPEVKRYCNNYLLGHIYIIYFYFDWINPCWKKENWDYFNSEQHVKSTCHPANLWCSQLPLCIMN